jgi:Arc/MetJ-type ribon-helix-helix transcriptional regulator
MKSYSQNCRICKLTQRGGNMRLITLYLPETYLKALDQLVTEKFYPNRAEAIRVAIRDMISEEVWRRQRVD